MICLISNKYLPFPTIPFKNTSGEISTRKPPGKRRKGHEQPATQRAGICSPHKIHPRIALQSCKITGKGEYLGRADAPAEAPGPRDLRRMTDENMRYRSHEYTTRKRNKKNLKITMKRGIIMVRTSRVWYDNCALWYCNCCFKIMNDYKKCAKNWRSYDDTYQVQVVSWYDNENSYTSQMVRTIKYFAENC